MAFRRFHRHTARRSHRSAACVWSHRKHSRGVQLQVRGDRNNAYSLEWPQVTEQVLRGFNDPEEATELGAVGVAILLAKREIGYSVIERSRKGTGFDYWLGDESELPFQNKARLEVSGIRKGRNQEIKTRVREKLRQVERSGVPPTAYVIVVEFGTPVAEVRENERDS